MPKFRIVQVSDLVFMVEELVRTWRSPIWPWRKGYWAEHWHRVKKVEKVGSSYYPVAIGFPSEAEAQKWVDDYRKYPIVIKEPA